MRRDSQRSLVGPLQQAIKKDEHEEFWQKHKALGPSSIARALFHDNVLRLVRREIRREEGLLIDLEDLAAAIHGMLSPEAREQIGPLRIRRRRPRTPRTRATTASSDTTEDSGAEEDVDQESTEPTP